MRIRECCVIFSKKCSAAKLERLICCTAMYGVGHFYIRSKTRACISARHAPYSTTWCVRGHFFAFVRRPVSCWVLWVAISTKQSCLRAKSAHNVKLLYQKGWECVSLVNMCFELGRILKSCFWHDVQSSIALRVLHFSALVIVWLTVSTIHMQQ